MLRSDHVRAIISESAKSSTADKQNHGPVAHGELLRQLLEFIWRENVFVAEAFL